MSADDDDDDCNNYFKWISISPLAARLYSEAKQAFELIWVQNM